MLRTLKTQNFTVFSDLSLEFGKSLNVIVGENGSGKSHLLKLLYSMLSSSYELGNRLDAPPSKASLQGALADKLSGVFRPESLGRLVRRKPGRAKSEISLTFKDKQLNLSFAFATNSRTEVVVEKRPQTWLTVPPAFLPTRELMSLYPGFVPLYEGRFLEFEETWRDTCLLLGQPALRGPRSEKAARLLVPLEKAMGGKVVLDGNGRFYLKVPGTGNMEMHLVAEGWRKLCMLAQLITNGSLLDKGYLFWDEPEANLNPVVVKIVAATIIDLAQAGIQVFIGTHSLFLLREIEILTQKDARSVDTMFIGLHPMSQGSEALQGRGIGDIGPIAALDASLQQSDRYLEL